MKDFIRQWLLFTSGMVLVLIFLGAMIVLPIYLIMEFSKWFWILLAFSGSIIGTLIFREI